MEGNEYKINLTYSKAASISALPRVSLGKSISEQAPTNGVSNKAASALANTEALITNISNQADSLKSYVKSLAGVISQGLKEQSFTRQVALEKEANQLFSAIKDKAVSVKRSEPVYSDPVRSEVEAKLGRALDILFPEPETKGLEISFSNKELIISIQTRIIKTSQYLDSLDEKNSPLPEELSEVMARAETAKVNAESSQSTVRDVESALKLAENASSLIGTEPKTAMSAIGDIRSQINLRS